MVRGRPHRPAPLGDLPRRELVPWIDATYRTIAARRGRAIAGVSMGGYGALSYAARHPDTFAAAASFSGALGARLRQARREQGS
jgi:S-formylglutathione hydrolase FrmB